MRQQHQVAILCVDGPDEERHGAVLLALLGRQVALPAALRILPVLDVSVAVHYPRMCSVWLDQGGSLARAHSKESLVRPTGSLTV